MTAGSAVQPGRAPPYTVDSDAARRSEEANGSPPLGGAPPGGLEMARLDDSGYMAGEWTMRPGEPMEAYIRRTDEALAELERESGRVDIEAGEVVGLVVKFPAADGHAVYRVSRASPLTLQHVPFGDAWRVPPAHIRGLRKSDILEAERAMRGTGIRRRPTAGPPPLKVEFWNSGVADAERALLAWTHLQVSVEDGRALITCRHCGTMLANFRLGDLFAGKGLIARPFCTCQLSAWGK